MMKRTTLFLFALMAMLGASVQSWAAQVTFQFVNNGSPLTEGLDYNVSVAIYKSGEEVASSRIQTYGEDYGKAYLYVDDSYVGQRVLYISSMGHQGYMTLAATDETQNLEVKKLSVAFQESDGSAVTSYQNLYLYNSDGKAFNVQYSPYSGSTQATTYLATGSYTYQWKDDNYYPPTILASGSFELNNDYEMTLKKSGSGGEEPKTEYNVKVVCRNGDYPVSASGNSFYFYKYGDKGNSVESAYMSQGNSFTVQLPAGSYWVRDPYYSMSPKIEVTGDMTAYLDYQKVTFVSMSGNTPNAGQEITLKPNDDSYYYSSQTLTTDANGKAKVYRLPGEFSYSVLGKTDKFTVNDQDVTVNINTSKVTIALSCDDMSALATQNFEWGERTSSSSGYSSSYSSVTPSDGKITISALPGNYELRVNGIGTYPVTVKEGENNVSLQLYSLMFTTNLSTMRNIYVNGRQFSFSEKYYLPTGEYYYSSSQYSSSYYNTYFTLEGNKEIALNYGKVTVTITDTNGEAADDIYVNTSGSSSYTDENGQVELTVPYGECTISVSGYETRTINVSGDVEESFTVPGYVTFNVVREGNPVEHVSLYDVNTENSVSADGHNGVFKARITPGGTYRIGSYKGTAVIEEGTTITLGTLSVSSEGMGIAVPMDEWGGTSKWGVVVGSTVRLTAIPVSDDKFQCWVVNGREIPSPVVDLTITDANTVATAVFDGLVPGVSVARPIHGDVNDDKIVNGTDIQEVINVIVNAE